MGNAAYSIASYARSAASDIAETFRGAQNTVKTVEGHIERQETSKLAANLAMTQAKLATEWQETLKNADPNDPAVASRFMEEKVQPALDGLDHGLWTSGAKDHYEKAVGQIKASMFASTAADQSRLAGEAQLVNLKRIGEAASETALNDPALLDSQLKLLRLNLDTIGKDLTAAQRQELFDNYAGQAEQSAWYTKIDRNPSAALKELDSGAAMYLSGQQVQALKDRADARKTADQDQALGVARFNFEDDLLRMQLGYEPANDWNDDTVAALAGTNRKGVRNEGQALRYLQTFHQAQAVGDEARNMKDLTFDEAAARVGKLEQEIGTADNAHVAKSRAEAAGAALDHSIKMFNKDAAAFVIQTNPIVSEAFQKFQQEPAPQRFQEYATMTAAEQRRKAGQVAAILPEAAIASIGEKLNSSTAQDPAGAQQAVATLAQWQQIAGPHWPEVIRDLQKAKVLAPTDYVAANLMGFGRGAAAKDLITAGRMKQDELVARGGGGENSSWAAVRKSAANALRPMLDSLQAQNGGQEIWDAQVDAITRLALFKGEPNKAASMAKELLLKDYAFRGSLRIPRSQDVGAIERGLSRAVDKMDLVAPESRLGQEPGEVIRQYRSALKDHAMWVTNEDESGAYLKDDTGTTVLERKNGTVQPVWRSWAELSARDLVRPSPKGITRGRDY